MAWPFNEDSRTERQKQIDALLTVGYSPVDLLGAMVGSSLVYSSAKIALKDRARIQKSAVKGRLKRQSQLQELDRLARRANDLRRPDTAAAAKPTDIARAPSTLGKAKDLRRLDTAAEFMPQNKAPKGGVPKIRAGVGANEINRALRGMGGAEAIREAKAQGVVPRLTGVSRRVADKHEAIAAAAYRRQGQAYAAAGADDLAAKYSRRADFLQRMAENKPGKGTGPAGWSGKIDAPPKTKPRSVQAGKAARAAGKAAQTGKMAKALPYAAPILGAAAAGYALTQGSTTAQAATLAVDVASGGSISEYNAWRKRGNNMAVSGLMTAVNYATFGAFSQAAADNVDRRDLRARGARMGARRQKAADLKAQAFEQAKMRGILSAGDIARGQQRRATAMPAADGYVKAHTKRVDGKTVKVGRRRMTKNELQRGPR